MSSVAKFIRKPIGNSIIAIIFGLVVAGVIVALSGYNPISTIVTLLYGMLGSPKYVANVIIKATPILLTGVAVSFAFQTGLFNIGAEGQYIAGTIAATIVGVTFDFPAIIQIPLVLIAGVLAAAALGALIGLLKAKFGIHEVITSIMFNWIMLYLCNFVASSEAFHRENSTSALIVNPSSYTMVLPQWKLSDEGIEFLLANPFLRDVLLKTDLNFGIVIAVLIAIGAGVLLARTKVGYAMRAVGFNKEAARFSGISVERNIILCMAISGGICGLAGALNITSISPHTITILGGQEGYGFNGLAVAFIAGCSCAGCIPASLLFSGLTYGGMTVQQMLGVPSETISIMIGVIVFFTAIPGIAPKIADFLERRKRTKDEEDNTKVEAGEA